MKEIMTIMAASMSIEKIISELNDACKEVLINPNSKEAMNHLNFYAHIFIMNQMTGGKIEKAIDVIKDMEKFDKVRNIMEPGKN
jgi:hypothetical protein